MQKHLSERTRLPVRENKRLSLKIPEYSLAIKKKIDWKHIEYLYCTPW